MATVTVISVCGVNGPEALRAIQRTQEALPFFTKSKLIYRPGMDLNEYSRYIVKELHHDIETDFALICQPDGIGLRPHLWSNEFFQYDYCGSPFPNGEVGNGGLSLRSRMFLRYCAGLPDPTMPEDAWICQYGRQHAEKSGIQFCPTAIGLRFSYEHPVDGIEWDPKLSWGVHGKWNLESD